MTKAKPTSEEIQQERAYEYYRKQVVNEELLARMNKAGYEKMYYFLEGLKLIPLYNEAISQQNERRREQESKADIAVETLLAEAKAAGGEIVDLQEGETTEDALERIGATSPGPEPEGSLNIAESKLSD